MRRAPILLSLCLFAALVFSASAQASGGTLMGWGYNYYGQLGNGQADTTSTCHCVPTPVSIPGLSGVSQTAGGYNHSIFLSTDGTVRTAGYNYAGQLGNDTTTESAVPITVPGLSNVIAIAGSGEASYALLSNGTVMSWGSNYYGQLGIGSSAGPEECAPTAPCSKHPLTVPGLSNVVAISAAGNTAYVLLADGTVMAWGENEDGQVGDGVGTETGCECVDHPVAIPGVANAIAISGGESWAMALLADRSVMTWGENYRGQIGNGDPTNYSLPCYCLPPTKTLTGVKTIAAGDYHGMAVMLNGSVETWGYNYYGQLGNGSNDQTSECDCVATPAVIPGYAGAQAATANYYNTMVLLGDGTVRGAGFNSAAELGDGTTTEERLSPVQTLGVGGASAVHLGYYGGFAIIGPSQTLSVALAGAGTGTVQGGGGEITCPTLCTAKYPQGKVPILTATSTAGGFAGFSGPCTGTATCQAKMETDQAVTATFGVPKGTKITKAKFTGKKLKKATFSFSAPGAITGYQCMLIRPKPKKHHKAKASKKQKKQKFSACTGPKAFKNLKPGKYTFKVRALDILGADAKPAKRAFKVHPPKKHKKKH